MNNQKIINFIEELKNLTLWDAIELVKQIEQTFGIDTAVQVPVINTPVLSTTEVAQDIIEEKTAFNITLIEVPADKKIAILKVVRHITGLGLKESKDIVDNIPKVLKEGVSKEDVDNIKKEIESLGGKVIIA